MKRCVKPIWPNTESERDSTLPGWLKFFLILSCLDYFVTVVVVVVMYFGDCTLESCCHFRL